jgi:hypothetical protein
MNSKKVTEFDQQTVCFNAGRAFSSAACPNTISQAGRRASSFAFVIVLVAAVRNVVITTSHGVRSLLGREAFHSFDYLLQDGVKLSQ